MTGKRMTDNRIYTFPGLAAKAGRLISGDGDLRGGREEGEGTPGHRGGGRFR